MLDRTIRTLLLIEARETVAKTIHQVNDAAARGREAIRNWGQTAEIAGQQYDAAMGRAVAATHRLTTEQALLERAQLELSAAQSELLAAQEARSAGAVGAIDAEAAAYQRLKLAEAEVAGMSGAVAASQAAISGAESEAALAADRSAAAQHRLKSSMSKIGPASLIAVAAVGLIAKKSLDAGIHYQHTTAAIANSANISTEAARQIGDAFVNTAGRSTFGAQEMASAYSKVAGQLGLTAGHALSTKEAMDFMNVATETAEASGQSLSGVTTNLSKVMQAYGMDSRQAGEAADSMYNASRLTGVGFNQLSNQVVRMKSQLGVLAPSIGDATTFMVDLTKHGITGRQAMMMMNTTMNQLVKTSKQTSPTVEEVGKAFSALPAKMQPLAQQYQNGEISAKEFQARLQELPKPMQTYGKQFMSLVDKSKLSADTLNSLKFTPVQQKLSQLGVSVFNSTGNFVGMRSVIGQLSPKVNALHTQQEKLALLQPIFGNNSRKMLGVIEGGVKEWDKYNKQLTDAKARHEAAERAQHTYEGSMKTFKATLGDVKIAIGNALMPAVTALMNGFLALMRPVIDFASHNKTLVKIIAGVVLGVTALIAVIYAANKVFQVIKGAIMIVRAAMWALNASFLANPIVLIILAVVGLIAGFILLYKHSKLVRDIVHSVGEFFKKAFHIALDVVKSVWNWVKSHWPLLLAIFTGPIGLAVKFIIDHWDGILSFFESLPGKIGGIFSSIGDFMWNGIKSGINLIISGINVLIDGFNKASGWISFGTIPKIPDIPKLAHGGPVKAGMPYIVGDGGGPELFIPNTAGQVLSNSKTMSLIGSSGGGGKNVIVNVHLSGQVYGSLDDLASKLGNHLATSVLPNAGVVLSR